MKDWKKNIEFEWDWLDEDNNSKFSIIQCELSFYPGIYSGPYENSFPDEWDYDIIDIEGDALDDYEIERFEKWLLEQDWEEL